mmetsp:Transcript_27074/g.42024  ORF Transcript_27074/g.42024 Transcript_27074/m.42024 type:complete len:216 (-) Transcript_27074:1575-2222(-)
MQHLANFLTIRDKVFVHRNKHDLTWAKPEGPFTSVVLTQYSKHTFHTAQHSSVHHNRSGELRRSILILFARLVSQIKSDGQLEIELNCSTLMHAIHGIHDFDVNLGSIERSITRIFAPVSGSNELIHSSCKGRLCRFPQFNISKRLLRPGTQFKFVTHTKCIVHIFHKVKCPHYLLLNLILSTVNVRIILLKSPHAGKSTQRSTEFIAVQYTKIS